MNDDDYDFRNSTVTRKIAQKLEVEFNIHRPFGDERDLNLFLSMCEHPGTIRCVIRKKSPLLYPELAFDRNNLIMMCDSCVREYIQNFKEYNKND